MTGTVDSFAGEIGLRWRNGAYLYGGLTQPNSFPLGLYETVELYGNRLGGTGISANVNLGFTTDTLSVERKRLEIFQGHIDWDDIGDRLDLRLGRQSVWELRGMPVVDGFRADVRIGDRVSLFGIAGVAVPGPYQSEVIGIDSAGPVVVGAMRAGAKLPSRTAAFLSYETRTRGGGAPHLAGIDISQALGAASSVRAGLRLDAEQLRLDEYRVVLSLIPAPVCAALIRSSYESYRIDTSFYLDSLVLRGHHEAGADLTFSPSRRIDISAGYTVRIFDAGDIAHHIEARAGLWRLNVSLQHASGYGGTRTQGDIAVIALNLDKLAGRLSGGLALYRDDGLHSERYDYAGLGTVGLDVFPAPFFHATGELQFVSNRYHTYDIRGLLRTTLTLSRFRS